MEFIAHWNEQNQFEIENCYDSKFRLHLEEKSCNCRRWELTGTPCDHAISALYYLGLDPEDFVDECYKKDTFLKSYSHFMGALNGCDMWPKMNMEPLLPPISQKLPGRPKLHARKKETDEKSQNKDKHGGKK